MSANMRRGKLIYQLTTTMSKDRKTKEPGGCECEHCGCIFIGGPEHSICGDCFAAYKEAMRQDEQRSEWHAEWRRLMG